MKKIVVSVLAGVAALGVTVFALMSLERVKAGNVGVMYDSQGVRAQTLSQGWHWMGPLPHVKQFPVSQQQIVFSDDPGDYNGKDHPDWHIDAPANGGMVGINLTVNYNFLPDKVVDLYKRFNGMDGEAIVESRVQNSIVTYVKEVTPQFTVMDLYSEKKAQVNQAITEHLNRKLTEEYGIHVAGALIIDVELDSGLQDKIRAKEQAKQDAEIAELDKQTTLAQAETDKVKADTAAQVQLIEARAQAEANRVIAQSITPELIQLKEAEARMKHGWVTVQGADTVVTGQ